jgi:hypothetical protein
MNLRHVLCISVLSFAIVPLASANQLLFEDFNYPTGSLDGQNGGTGWAGSWVAPAEYNVVSGSLTYPQLAHSGNRAQFDPSSLAGTNAIRTLSPLGPNGSTFWLSFLLSFDGTLAQNTADVRLDAMNGSIYLGRPLSSQINWGVGDAAQGNANPYSESSIPIVSGSPVFVVLRIDLNSDPKANDTTTVYFNPDVATTQGANPGVPGMVFNDLNFSSGNVTLALDGSAFPNPLTTGFRANYDPIRGGTTYADVAPAVPATVPEPATWSLIAVALAFLGTTARWRRHGRAKGRDLTTG